MRSSVAVQIGIGSELAIAGIGVAHGYRQRSHSTMPAGMGEKKMHDGHGKQTSRSGR